MSRKRQNTSSAEPESPVQKQQRSASIQSFGYDDSSLDNNYEQPRIDTKTGLAGAFPGLVDDFNEGLFYGPAEDGLDYLRMVRSEAKGIPNLLTAATSAPQTNDVDAREEEGCEGFFDGDEAVVAAPVLPQEPGTTLSKPQRLYYESILARFNALRRAIRAAPPLSAVQAMSEAIPISFPSASKNARNSWQAFVTQNAAHPVQVACMDADSIIELIRLMTRKMRKFLGSSDTKALHNIGTWFWAGLARCPDRGELGSEEISDLRLCAKMAADTWRWLQAREENATLGSEASNEDSEDEEDGDVSIEEATYEKDDHESNLRPLCEPKVAAGIGTSSKYPLLKHHVIIEMIITVVGETYGQRDLLDLRRIWSPPSAG